MTHDPNDANTPLVDDVVARMARIRADHAPPNKKGRLLGTGDIMQLMTVTDRRGDVKGPSAWYVTHYVCPQGKHVIGRNCYWWEADFLAWFKERGLRPRVRKNSRKPKSESQAA